MSERSAARRPPRGIPPVAVSSTTTRENATGSWRYIRPVQRDLVAPCNAACPVGIDVEGYLNLLREGDLEGARGLLVRENPMPAVTGRVCDHPCEAACNRRHVDEAVSVHAVERWLGDRILEEPLPPPRLETGAASVAVVGSGPAGLAAAYHLSGLGHAVTIFEAALEPGGMLRLGIPEYRLPRAVLDRSIDRILAEGIELRCGVRVGEDVGWDELAHHDAVFVATGAHGSRAAGFEGEEHPSVRPGLQFLKEVNAGARPDPGERVVVVGGGNTAMDCARTALRLGADDVLVLYRRSRAEMPAIEDEVLDAEREGVRFHFLAAPAAIRTEGDRLLGVECTPMRLGPRDASGRRRPVPSGEKPVFVRADTVLTAIGENVEAGFLPDGARVEGGVVPSDWLGATRAPGVFVGGDLADQPRTVAHALGAGKRAALAIHRYLRGEEAADDLASLRYGESGNVSVTRWLDDDPIPRSSPANRVVPWEEMNPAHFRSRPRNPDRHRDPDACCHFFGEMNLGLPDGQGLDEALRCLNCGVCNGCELCLIFCPDTAVIRDGGPHGLAIDLEYCKGCGLCVAECPRGAMTMVEEGAS